MIGTMIVAVAAGIAGTWCARSLALRLGHVAHPNPLVVQHTRPVAYLGGVGVAIGTAATMTAVPLWLWFPALLFLALGIADDARPFAPHEKLALQAGVASVAVLLGYSSNWSANPWVNGVIGWMWIIVLVNAVNVTDVCDGLVAGISVPVFLGMASLNAAQEPLALAAAGACAGFLVFNRPPATIFLGDGGSHFLGFLMAALTPISKPTLVPSLLVTGVFLFEVGFLIVVRWRKGLRWWAGSPDHFSMKLLDRGLSRVHTDAVAIVSAALLAAMSVMVADEQLVMQIAWLVAACVMGLLAGRVLLHPKEAAEPSSSGA